MKTKVRTAFAVEMNSGNPKEWSNAMELEPERIRRVNKVAVQTPVSNVLIEFRCVVTVSTPAVWLARENIKS